MSTRDSGAQGYARELIERLLREHAESPDVVTLAKELEYAFEQLAVDTEQLRQRDEEATLLATMVEQERHRRRGFFETAPDPYVVTDLSGIVRERNEQTSVALPRVTIDRPLVLAVDSADRAAFYRFLSGVATGDGHATLSFFGPDGVVRMDIQCRRLEPDRLLWLLRDVTEIEAARENANRLAEEDRRVAEQLREVDELRRAFLLTISHDLRTPLAAIAGLADILALHPELDTERRGEVVDRIRETARRVTALFSDLIDFDRLERQELALRREQVDVSAVIADVCDRVELGSRTLTVDAPEALASVDATLVDRIVENLLANAARHAPETAQIWVRCSREPDGVLIVVEDDGPGVAPELVSRIFDLFQRDRRSESGDGFGVGLALVRRFAELHGGYARLQPRAGGGAAFVVLLPER